MSKVPDAWDDEWSAAADARVLPAPETSGTDVKQNTITPPEQEETKKVSSKVSKAQRRAQQAEFNRQLWAEAYAFHPREPRPS